MNQELMNFIHIPSELFNEICKYFNDVEFITLTATCKTFGKYTKCKKLTNMYGAIIIGNLKNKFTFTKMFYEGYKLNSCVFLDLNTITHLTFNGIFNHEFKHMPSSVTHLCAHNTSFSTEDKKYLSSIICLDLSKCYKGFNYAHGKSFDKIKRMFYNKGFVIKYSTDEKDLFVKVDHKLCKRCWDVIEFLG